MTDKLEVLCRAWIECDPNRHVDPDEIMGGWKDEEIKDAAGNVIGAVASGVGPDLAGKPRWHWFLPRAVALEEYLERHGFVIVRAERVGLSGRP
jgi:hypothetical protein